MRKFEKDIEVTNDGDLYATSIILGDHRLKGDEPVKAGGRDLGPTSHQLLLSSLGNCIAITLRMYANRKEWDLKKVSVYLNMEHVREGNEEKNIIYKKVLLEGELSAEQQERLLSISNRCPIHQLLTGKIEIQS